MPQQGSDSNSKEDVTVRSEGSQYRYGRARLESVLNRTGGIVPGSIPKKGDIAFIKDRITKFEPIDDNQSLNQAQLEELKRQLAEKERTQTTQQASKGVGPSPKAAQSLPPKRTEAQADLLGIIEVRTPLRNLATDRKAELARMSVTAIANETPNISEDGLELGPIITRKERVSVVMEGQTVSIMVANATGGGVHEMARHVRNQVAAMVHTGNDQVVVYIGRDTMGRRTAVVLKFPSRVEYTNVVSHFQVN